MAAIIEIGGVARAAAGTGCWMKSCCIFVVFLCASGATGYAYLIDRDQLSIAGSISSIRCYLGSVGALAAFLFESIIPDSEPSPCPNLSATGGPSSQF